jgi:DNA (cytosine-5)-methyltransferase 1
MNEVVWVVDRRTDSKDGRGGMVPTVTVPPITEPAPTFTGKSGGQWLIRPPDGALEPCDDGEQGAPHPCDGESEHERRPEWTRERHATTVVGSFNPDVIAAPGYRTTISRQDAPDSVKVTIAEAAVLQSFRPDYPWQGSRTKQFEQIGNAVPPRLGMHVIASVLGMAVPS